MEGAGVVPAGGSPVMRGSDLNHLTSAIIGAAIKVHRALGPGLLESAYSACLQFELVRQGYKVESEKDTPIMYDGLTIDVGFRMDLLVNDLVVVEVKAVQKVIPIFEVQLLTYLRLSGRCLGLLINFNHAVLKDGIYRVIDDGHS